MLDITKYIASNKRNRNPMAYYKNSVTSVGDDELCMSAYGRLKEIGHRDVIDDIETMKRMIDCAKKRVMFYYHANHHAMDAHNLHYAGGWSLERVLDYLTRFGLKYKWVDQPETNDYPGPHVGRFEIEGSSHVLIPREDYIPLIKALRSAK